MRMNFLSTFAWSAAIVSTFVISGCGSLIVTQRSVESLANEGGFNWETRKTDSFVLYAESGSTAATDLNEIEAGARRSKERVLAYLQEPAFEPTVAVFLVENRDRMNDLIGRRPNATAFLSSNALCLVWSESLKVGATHELLHIVAMQLWGVPERWVNEGTAVDATGSWHGHDLHSVCKDLRADGYLPSLRDLTQHFGRVPDLVTYPAAGSFVSFLRETYGLGTVRQVWNDGRGALPEATGMDLDSLEAAWLAVVENAAWDIEYKR